MKDSVVNHMRTAVETIVTRVLIFLWSK